MEKEGRSTTASLRPRGRPRAFRLESTLLSFADSRKSTRKGTNGRTKPPPQQPLSKGNDRRKRHLALTALSYRTLVASYTHTSTLPARSRCCHWSLLFGCWKGVKKEKVFKKRVRVVVGGLSGWFWSFGNHTTRAICVLMLLGRAVVHLPFAIVRG